MPLASFGSRSVAATDLLAAVAAADWDRAEAVWPQIKGGQTDAVWLAVAELHTAKLRWDEVAGALGNVKKPDDAVRNRQRLARNLAALKIHRPLTYRSVIDAGPADIYRIHVSENGQKSIIVQAPGDVPTYLSRDPAATTTAAMKQLGPMCARGETLALLSVGDGHVLAALSADSPKLYRDREQTLFLFEPDPRLLLACLLIHDFTGPAGPIEQQRVRWYVGEHWATAYRVDAVTDRYLPFPQTNVKLGVAPKPIESALQDVLAEVVRADDAARLSAEAYYQCMSANDFQRAMAGELGRPPRVMLITTRLSSVLQYSTRDTADAFRRLGWSAQVCIEPTPHHAMTRTALRRTLAEFKPDVVFQIDHHRFEHTDLFPANVPFVNWIQDLLPNLMTRSAGQKLGQRDFSLTPSLQRWVDDFAYPARQCIEFRKLTRIPERPVSWHRGDNVVYVSNWSQQPQTIRDELIRGATGKTLEVLDTACQRMIDLYAAGGTLHTPGDVRRLLLGVTADLEVAADESLMRQTTTRLFDRMNNLLYRQQGLTWAIAAARDAGLQLQIFGAGWEKNPQFAAFAAGVVEYGQPLEEITRNAGANLVLEPFVCIAHQRLLDALVAGGFCLVRNTPGNAILHALIECVGRADSSWRTEGAMRRGLNNQDDREQFESIMRACAGIESDKGFDHIANTRRLIESGFVEPAGELLPRLDHVLFDNPSQLGDALTRFTRDDELRSQIARQQRQAVEKRYSYAAGMSRMVHFLCDRLASERHELAQAA